MLEMNYAEILDKINGIITDSDEYIAILMSLENIKAVTVAGVRYFECCSVEPEIERDIAALFRTINSVVGLVNGQIKKLTQLITDTASGKITPENSLVETEVKKGDE